MPAGVGMLVLLYSRFAETPAAGRALHAGAEIAVLGLAATVFGLRTIHGGSRGLTSLSSFWSAAVIYLAVLYASSIWAVDSDAAIAQANTLTANLLVVYVLVEVFDTTPSQRIAAWTLIATGSGLAALAIFQAVTRTYGHSYFGLAEAGVQQIVGTMHGYRSAGPVGDPNFFGVALVAVLPVGLFRLRYEADRRLRIAAGLAVVVLLGGIGLTYSRSAMVAVAVVFVGWAVMVKMDGRRILLGGLILLPLTLAAPRPFIQRAASIFSNDQSISGRTQSDQVALDIFAHHPLIGVGADNYHVTYFRYAVEQHALDAVPYAHNLYLAVAAETGLLGVSAFGLAIAIAIGLARRAWAEDPPRAGHPGGELSGAFLLALVACLVGGAFLPLAFPRYLWIVVGLALATSLPNRPA
jgi:putative inorganic carbon (HCO3(-)) transporter